jgi:hypothetical protein
MTRVLVVAAVALAAIVVYAATAPAGQQAVTPKQFSALAKRVTKLEKDNKLLKDAAGFMLLCGFNKGAIATTKTPQYHVPAAGEATDFYVLTTTDQQCVTIINSPVARRLLRKISAR